MRVFHLLAWRSGSKGILNSIFDLSGFGPRLFRCRVPGGTADLEGALYGCPASRNFQPPSMWKLSPETA